MSVVANVVLYLVIVFFDVLERLRIVIFLLDNVMITSYIVLHHSYKTGPSLSQAAVVMGDLRVKGNKPEQSNKMTKLRPSQGFWGTWE